VRHRPGRRPHGMRAPSRLRAGGRDLALRRRGLLVGRGAGRGRIDASADQRPAARLRGRQRAGADHDAPGRGGVRRPRLERARGSAHVPGGGTAARLHLRLLERVAAAGRLPGPPVADLPAAQRARAQGPDVRAHRRDGRRPHHVAPRDPRRQPQLGLPLQLDPRLDVHAVGALHARLRRGGQRLLLLHPGRGGHERQAPGHVRGGGRAAAARAHARPPERVRLRASGSRRQRRLPPPAARRLGRAAGLDLPAHPVARRPRGVDVDDAVQPGR
jgi:hypothetical protein